jgi:hypothetical protein
MAKLDTSKIPNFDALPDDVKSILSNYEIPDPDFSGYVKKDVFDKAASEAADWKKKYQSKLSEEEKKEAERAETQKKLEDELNALRRESAISKSKAEFIAAGYDETLADEAAKALADGDFAKFSSVQKTFVENLKKAARAAALADDPKPGPGHGDPPKDQRAKLIEAYNEAEKRGDFVACQAIQQQIKALPKE